MAEIIGTAASILQLVGSLAKGLEVIRNTYVAIRDVHKRVEELQNNVSQVGLLILAIQKYIESGRLAKFDSELQFHDVISDVTKCCLTSLKTIQKGLPALPGPTDRAITAIKLWMQNEENEQARKHIQGALQNLELILDLLQLYVDNATFNWLIYTC